jgi:hypothetical protein
MKYLSLLALTTISLGFGSINLASAATLTPTQFSMSFNRQTSNLGGGIGICGDVGICQANVATIVPDVNPGIETLPEAYINDTGFAIAGIFAKLLPNRPEGPAIFIGGTSDIFSNIDLSKDFQELSFTQGIIARNEIIIADFETEPDTNSALYLTLTTTPEPSLREILILGSLIISLRAGKRHKKQFNLLNAKK